MNHPTIFYTQLLLHSGLQGLTVIGQVTPYISGQLIAGTNKRQTTIHAPIDNFECLIHPQVHVFGL